MACKILLRSDQLSTHPGKFATNKVCIFAPYWVRDALATLGSHLDGKRFDLCKGDGGSMRVVETVTISKNFKNWSLRLLQRIARNEPRNVTGIVNMELYDGIDPRIVYSLRDLVRQCVIVGVDESIASGGYRCPWEPGGHERVYVCDLAALQFQQPYNTGRSVLLCKNQKIPMGILDDTIYTNVVNERKANYEDVLAMLNNPLENESNTMLDERYVECASERGCSTILDLKAYKAFVKNDVVLAGMGLVAMVRMHYPCDKVLFKFLKYGTGFFAGPYGHILERHILSGVLDGLDELFDVCGVRDVIREVELPFFNESADTIARVARIREKVSLTFSTRDAMKHTDLKLKLATTNCGDNAATFGNEMNYGSVDAAVAENLKSKGNIFSANLNRAMEEQFLELPCTQRYLP